MIYTVHDKRELCRFSHEYAGLNKTKQDDAGKYWTIQDYIRLYRSIQDCWTMQDYTAYNTIKDYKVLYRQ